MGTRRGFLWLCGASGAGIFLAGTGLIELPRKMVLQLAGKCSFCGKDRREVFGIAGVVGQELRICDECIGLCFDILAEEIGAANTSEVAAALDVSDPLPLSSASDELERLLRSASSIPDADPRELIDLIQARLTQPSADAGLVRPRDFHCSFCHRSRHDVRKLISGPRVFICDDCVGDAAGLLARSGWRVRLSFG